MLKLKTKQLKMVSVQKKYLPQIFKIWTDPDNGKYMPDSNWNNPDELKVILEENNEYYSFAAFLHKNNDSVVATCNIQRDDSFSCGDWTIGYNVHKDYWSKGLATEMVQALIDFAFNLKAKSITTSAAKENTASCKVLEKCGFKLIGEGKMMCSDITYTENIYCLNL